MVTVKVRKYECVRARNAVVKGKAIDKNSWKNIKNVGAGRFSVH